MHERQPHAAPSAMRSPPPFKNRGAVQFHVALEGHLHFLELVGRCQLQEALER